MARVSAEVHVGDAAVRFNRGLQLFEAADVVCLSRQRALQVELERSATALRGPVPGGTDALRLVMMMPVVVVMVAPGAMLVAVVMTVVVRAARTVLVLRGVSMPVVMRAAGTVLVLVLLGVPVSMTVIMPMVVRAAGAVLVFLRMGVLMPVAMVMPVSVRMVMTVVMVMLAPRPVHVRLGLRRADDLQLLEGELPGGLHGRQ
ncbi:hypothetical protein [Pyxidicoccus parkwayensis]|uniref:hypothetical protein n=1 Tax=Pyxidicoccus parkwayensis TaxID=2813578 RepID=UPI001F50EE2D|nr:hypothetical protein [Pyxidicoccus parkwaysis]